MKDFCLSHTSSLYGNLEAILKMVTASELTYESLRHQSTEDSRGISWAQQAPQEEFSVTSPAPMAEGESQRDMAAPQQGHEAVLLSPGKGVAIPLLWKCHPHSILGAAGATSFDCQGAFPAVPPDSYKKVQCGHHFSALVAFSCRMGVCLPSTGLQDGAAVNPGNCSSQRWEETAPTNNNRAH